MQGGMRGKGEGKTMIPKLIRGRKSSRVDSGWDYNGNGKKGREGKAGEIMNGCKQKWGPFRHVARQGGVW